MPAIPKVLRYANKYVGVLESSPNRGERIDRWLIDAGAATGQPWCAAFAYGIAREAGYKPEIRYPASVRSWYAWAAETKRIREKPKPGMAVLFDWDGDGADDHIGFVVSATLAPGIVRLTTIEGNTREPGQPADGVRKRRRVCRRSRVVFVSLD